MKVNSEENQVSGAIKIELTNLEKEFIPNRRKEGPLVPRQKGFLTLPEANELVNAGCVTANM